jgi:hypothetical protein
MTRKMPLKAGVVGRDWNIFNSKVHRSPESLCR